MEIVNCWCGRKAIVRIFPTNQQPKPSSVYQAYCSIGMNCCRGPLRKTERGAITAWNLIMGQFANRGKPK